jgi:hypothetical protein
MQARTTLGANAFISYDWALQKDKLIYSDGNKNQLPNLLKFTSGSDSGIGVEGVLALQATYIPVQVFSSPTPTPPPPPPGPYPSQIPYTACNASQEKQLATASTTAYRLLPYFIVNSDKCKKENQATPAGNDFLGIFAIERDVMVCKKNAPANIYAESLNYPCAVPPAWKTCVTSYKNAPSTTFSGYDYITKIPSNDEGDYCWQPVMETYQSQDTEEDVLTVTLGSKKTLAYRPGMAICHPNGSCYKLRFARYGEWIW